tara:strand:- start:167 stop:343 length:177 start_codon:yes stop_codon:yes gene_type:complete
MMQIVQMAVFMRGVMPGRARGVKPVGMIRKAEDIKEIRNVYLRNIQYSNKYYFTNIYI